MNKVKIMGSIWFSSLKFPIIGIILVNTGFKDKAYIGIGSGVDEKEDEKSILQFGGKFPLDQAKQLIGGK